LDVLAPKWSLNGKTFYDYVVGENEPNDILEARNVIRGRGTDRDDSDWLETKLLSDCWMDYTPCCPSINHALDSNRLWDLRTDLLESFLDRNANPYAHVH
jgi:hypothetical protein